jgi:hypothetical protein
MLKAKGAFLLAAIVFLFAGQAAAHPATGIVVDRKGQVYFSDLETVWKIDTLGKLSVFRSGVSGRHVHELTIDDLGNVYGEDVSYESATEKWISDVWRMTPEGALTYLVAPTTDPPRGLTMWRDREGNTYFIDQNNHLKQRTLLLRRTPDGIVTTFAGGAYGHRDGKGISAQFSSVGGMAFGPDGNLYLTDGTYVRKVAMDGSVTTLATDLNSRTAEDKPTLFGGLYGSLAGLTASSSGTVYVADAGNRRLLRISRDGRVDVMLRTDPPYFPNGVFATPAGDLYVLEVGFTLPNVSSGPRVRKISPDGKNVILVVVGEEGGRRARTVVAERLGVTLESALAFLVDAGPIGYGIVVVSGGFLISGALLWRRRRRQRLKA